MHVLFVIFKVYKSWMYIYVQYWEKVTINSGQI